MIVRNLKNTYSDMKRRDWSWLFLIILGAIVFRLIFVTRIAAIGFDEVNYLKLAASGKINGLNHVLHTYWSPFYPLVVTVFSFVVPNFELAGRLVSLLLSSLILVPLFFFVKDTINKKVAFITLLIAAFYSFSAYYSAKAGAEFVYSFTGILGIITGWWALHKKQSGKAFVTGILFALTYLTRPEGIGFLIVFEMMVSAIILFQIIHREKIKKYIEIFLLCGIGFGIVSSPYLLYLHQETGTWTISTKGTVNQQGEMYVMKKNMYQENPFHVLSEDNTRLLQDEIYHLGSFVKNSRDTTGPVVKVSLTNLLAKISANLYKLITEDLTNILPVFLMLFLGLGLFAHPWDRGRSLINLYLLSYIIFFWFVLIPLFHINLRYFVPLLPISFIWIAAGVDHFLDWFAATMHNHVRSGISSRSLLSIGVILVVLIFLVSILPEFGKRIKKNLYSTEEWAPSIEQKKAGYWLRENGIANPIVMAYNHAVSFYAGNYNIQESVEIPENDVDRLLSYARYRGVNYLVLNDRYQHNHPLIAHLYEQRDIPPDLRLIYSDVEKNGLKTLIYELNP